MADTSRMKALKQLSSQMPVASERTAQGLQSARDIQFRQSIGAAPAGAGVQQAQQLGTAATAQAGQDVLAQAQTGQATQGQIGQAALGEQAAQAQQQLAGQQEGLFAKREQLSTQLANIDEKAAQAIFDERMQFQRDERGRTFFNERQLADWRITQAKDEEEFANWAQGAQHAHKRKIQILETLHRSVLAEMEKTAKLGQQKANQQHKMKLIQMERDLKKKIREANAKAGSSAAMWGAAGTVVGAVVGSVIPGAGTAAGAVVGGAVGTAIGSQVG